MHQIRRAVVFLQIACFAFAAQVAVAEQLNPLPYPPLPEGISSFGAVTAGDAIYVLGGHMGRVPGNSVDGLSPHFCRLKLSVPDAGWEELPMQQSSQSPGLVEWNGKVYRVGGLSFQNHANEETAYESLSLFAKFDPDTKTWTNLPSLPAGRSSLDAAVVDGKVYVIGGWNLQGASAQGAEWHDDALVFDLANEQGAWTPIAKPPFQTRALAAASHDHKLFVLGGMKSNNQTTREVHIYDPKTNSWSAGPELKSSNTFGGFAISAYATGGHLYYNGGDGGIYRLTDSNDGWTLIDRLLFPRMFHRLVPIANDKLAVIAGVSGGAYLASLEVVSVQDAAPGRVKLAKWTVPFSGQVRNSQTLLIHGGALYAFGGNRSSKNHDFSREAFVNDAYRFDLAARTVEALPPLPQAMQSGAAVLAGRRIDQSIYVLGGLAPTDEKFGSTDVIQQYRLRSKAWSDDVRHLPAGRAMFSAAMHGGSAWIFGGSHIGSSSRGLAADTWEWNPTDDDNVHAVAEAAIPVPRRSYGSTVFGDQFYAVGGLGNGTSIADVANVFDFKSRQWSDIPAPKHARVFPSLAAAGGKLYLSGGFAQVDGHFAGATAVEVYSPETKTWTSTLEEYAPMLAEMTMLEFQDRLLFYNIDKDHEGLAHFVLLDPNPQSVGPSAITNATEERTGAADLVVRLMRMDKNQDGSLSADEVGARFQPILAQADEDKNGVVTRAEIEAFAKREEESNRPAGGPPGRGERPGRDPVRSAERLVKDNDSNGDGKLTGDEVPSRFKDDIARIDSNQDGAIDQQELEAFLRTSRERAGERATP